MADLILNKVTNVRSLIKLLKTLPPDALVIQSCDEEGNSFLPLAGALECLYLPTEENVWPVDDKDAPPSEAHPVVCLWPKHNWDEQTWKG